MSRYYLSNDSKAYRVVVVSRDRNGKIEESMCGPYELMGTAKGVCTKKIKSIARYSDILEFYIEVADNWTKVYGEKAP